MQNISHYFNCSPALRNTPSCSVSAFFNCVKRLKEIFCFALRKWAKPRATVNDTLAPRQTFTSIQMILGKLLLFVYDKDVFNVWLTTSTGGTGCRFASSQTQPFVFLESSQMKWHFCNYCRAVFSLADFVSHTPVLVFRQSSWL